MKVAITQETVEARWPGVTQRLSDALAGSRSRERGRPAADLTFAVEWCVTIGGYTGPNGLAQALRASRHREAPALDEQAVIAKFGPRVQWWVTATVGRWQGRLGLGDGLPADAPLPPEIVRHHLDQERREAGELGRVAALTPEQRNAEAQAAMAKLSRSPGFAAFGLRLDPSLLDEADGDTPPPGPRR